MQETSISKHTFTLICGHTETLKFIGDELDVYEQVQYMAKYCICPKCMLMNKHSWKYIPFERAVELAGFDSLPSLTGHFKNIRHAMMIRAQTLAIPKDFLWNIFIQEDNAVCSISPKHDNAMFYKKWGDCSTHNQLHGHIIEMAKRKVDACWWIEAQEHAARELCQELIWTHRP